MVGTLGPLAEELGGCAVSVTSCPGTDAARAAPPSEASPFCSGLGWGQLRPIVGVIPGQRAYSQSCT